MSKFTSAQKAQIKSIVATLSIKQFPDSEIIKTIYEQTNKTITNMELWNIRKRIARESYEWYQQLKKGQYEFIHKFRERINEINWMQQQKHHRIIEDNAKRPSIQQASLAELHKLTVTLSNLYDVAPYIISSIKNNNDTSISVKSEDTKDIIV